MEPQPDALADRLRASLGSDAVVQEPYALRASARSAYPISTKEALWGEGVPAYALAYPGTVEQVAAVLRLCADYQYPVVPYGGASGICGGVEAGADVVVIDTKRLAHMELSEENSLVRVGAGAFWQELEDYLQARGWTTGHYPQSVQSATVGGMVSTRGVGTFSGKYGKVDDMVRALEVVLPSGQIIRTPRYTEGRYPPPKRSCGPELRELFMGAEGAFGVITEVLLTIWRCPETRVWDAVTFATTESALQALRRIHQGDLLPSLVRLYDEDESEEKLKHFGYSGDAALLLLGYEGDAEVCDLICRRVADICRTHGGHARGPEAAEAWYARRLGTERLVGALEMDTGIADAIEVSAPWDRLVPVWQAMRNALLPLCDTVHCHFSHFYRTGGSIYVIFTAAPRVANHGAVLAHYRRCVEAALDACVTAGGSISHHHGIGRSKAPWMEQEHGAALALLRQIKHLLDPASLMNPGVLGLV